MNVEVKPGSPRRRHRRLGGASHPSVVVHPAFAAGGAERAAGGEEGITPARGAARYHGLDSRWRRKQQFVVNS